MADVTRAEFEAHMRVKHTAEYVEEERFSFDLKKFKRTDKYSMSTCFYPSIQWSEEGRIRNLVAYQYKRGGVVPEWLATCDWQLPAQREAMERAERRRVHLQDRLLRAQTEELKKLGWLNGQSAGWYDGAAQDPEGYHEDLIDGPVPTVDDLLRCHESMEEASPTPAPAVSQVCSQENAKRRLIFEDISPAASPVPLATSSPLFKLSEWPAVAAPPVVEAEEDCYAIEQVDSPSPEPAAPSSPANSTALLQERKETGVAAADEWGTDDEGDLEENLKFNAACAKKAAFKASKLMAEAGRAVSKLKWVIDRHNTKTLKRDKLTEMQDRLARFKEIYRQRKADYREKDALYEKALAACHAMRTESPDRGPSPLWAWGL